VHALSQGKHYFLIASPYNPFGHELVHDPLLKNKSLLQVKQVFANPSLHVKHLGLHG